MRGVSDPPLARRRCLRMSLGGYPVDSQVVHRTLFLHNMEGVSDPSMEIESEQEVEWNSPYTTTVARGYFTSYPYPGRGV